VIEIGSRRRNQPAPPHAVFEALADPDRDPARPWLTLLDDELRPQVVRSEALVGHLGKRLNQLINANLRYTFGQ
jgi:hypothetical protein